VREIALPGIGSVSGFGGKRGDTETFFSFTGFTTPTTIYRLDMKSGKTTVFRKPKVDFDPADYETRQQFYTSRDGTKVPMFIVSKKGLKLDGANPTYLYGYGGFNISMTPGFSPANLAWMEMGGVYVVANLRGGGEYGEAWHEAGTKLQKQNVFDDFIGAAEWLVNNKVTSPAKLAIGGGSNGGLLVGAAMTQRPELFGAAIPQVGVMDMLRFHKFTIGWAWTSDYGSSENAGRVQGAGEVFAAAQPEAGHLLSGHHDHHGRPRRPRGAGAQLQVRRHRPGRAGRRQSDHHPHRHQGRPRRRQADQQADRGSGGPLGLPDEGAEDERGAAGGGAVRSNPASGSRRFRRLIAQARDQPLQRHRPVEQIALHRRAAMLGQEARLLVALDAFRHHAQAEVAGHRQDRLHDRGAVGVVRRVAHEALVDLQLVQRHLLQVGQVRVAGAEVVDREADPERGQLAHAADGLADVLDQQAFGDFEDQLLRRRAGLLQHGAHLGHEIRLAELQRTDVDRQRQRMAGGVQRQPCRQASRSTQRPSGTIRPLDFGHGMNTSGGTKLPSARRQRISSSAPAGWPSWSTCSCRCIASSPFSSACARSRSSDRLALGVRQHRRLEQRHAVAALGLGVVHRGVGFAQQVVGSARRLCSGRATPMLAEVWYGWPSISTGSASAARILSATAAPRGSRRAGSDVQAVQQHHEFVAADARHDVALAHRAAQALGRMHQQRVAGGVAAGVVDVLEVVEVDVQHGAEAAPVLRLASIASRRSISRRRFGRPVSTS
jgi:hypothetical protein